MAPSPVSGSVRNDIAPPSRRSPHRGFLVLSFLLASSLSAAEPELRLELVRESLTGRHERHRQTIDGLPVVGGEVTITRDARGAVTREERRLARADGTTRVLSRNPATHVVNVNGVPRLARRVLRGAPPPPAVPSPALATHAAAGGGAPLRPVAEYRDVVTNDLLYFEPLYFTAKAARVFEINPVSKLNDPALRDLNDAASAVPATAYSDVELLGANDSGALAGPYVTISDFENPAIPAVDATRPLVFNREEDGFEDVNAFFHVERMQTYLQSLGYAGSRQLVPYSILLDPHGAGGSDNSFYVSSSQVGRGVLVFGDGGTDDAEDSDLIVHEYGHAMLDWISPLTFTGPFAGEARALGEGFCDYWSFSYHYDANVASGRDAACFADWDARCSGDDPSQRCAYSPNADCLRRVDSPKTMADYSRVESSGTEHRNGEIWSSAMRDIFLSAGKRVTDTLAIEAAFGMPPNPTFAEYARRLLFTDRLLFAGAHANAICSAMTARGILAAADCSSVPRGERSYFQSSDQGIAIPDNNPAGISAETFVLATTRIARVFVRVDIDHSSRGDLRLVLVAPDGTQFVLQNPGNDGASGLHVTYGVDAEPVESLEPLRGRSPAGAWKLLVTDLRPLDSGVLVSWSLAIQHEGVEPSPVRPGIAINRQLVPVVGHVAGVGGTRFLSDLRLFGIEAPFTNVTLVFTPSGANGKSDFAAVNLTLYPGQTVAYDDIVRTLFNSVGMGQLEVTSNWPIVVSTRTHTLGEGTLGDGTLGEHVPPVADGALLLLLPIVQRDEKFRTNLGFAETAGQSGRVHVSFFHAATGAAAFDETYDIAAHSHLQVPLTREGIYSAEVRAEGNARLAAYASIVDNRSGDAIHIAGSLPNSGGGVAPAIEAGGVNSYWTTDAFVSFAAAGSSRSRFRYIESGGGTYDRDLINPEPHQTVVFDSVIRNLFRDPPTIGGFDFGKEALAVLRIYTAAPNGGTLGQAVPLERSEDYSRDVLFVENGGHYRTNIGAVNSGVPIRLRFTVYDAGGTELGRTERSLHESDAVQFPLVSVIGPRLLRNGRVHIERIDFLGSRSIFAGYGSLVDNRSSDPSYIPAQ
jgi:subtilisin-like proprotein convertase family protein